MPDRRKACQGPIGLGLGSFSPQPFFLSSLTSLFLTVSHYPLRSFPPFKHDLFSRSLAGPRFLNFFRPPFPSSLHDAPGVKSQPLLSPFTTTPSPSSPSTPFSLHDRSPRSQQPWTGHTDLRPCAPHTLPPETPPGPTSEVPRNE